MLLEYTKNEVDKCAAEERATCDEFIEISVETQLQII